MTSKTSRRSSWKPPWKSLICIVILLLFAGLRFVYLQADFPLGLGDKGMTYTDEGWWSRNAVAWVREGNWYIDDGYNTITALPVLPAIQVVWFKLFGVSLASARTITAISSILISGLVYLLARRELSTDLAWIAPFIVLTNYPTFAYSRLALLEMPMLLLILLSLWLVTGLSPRSPLEPYRQPYLKLIISGVLLVLAVLTKTTALFALPVILLSIYFEPGSESTLSQNRRTKNSVNAIFIWLLTIVVVLVIGYFFLSQGGDAQSQTYFSEHNVTAKVPSLASLWKGPLRVIERILRIFPLLFIGLLGAIAFLFKARKHQSSQLFRIVVFWSVAVLGAFSFSDFAAPRYFLVLIVPMALIVPLSIEQIMLESKPKSRSKSNLKSKPKSDSFTFRQAPLAGLVLLLVFLSSTGYSLFRIGNYLSSPQFTLITTASSIERYITSDIASDSAQSNVLMGHFADTIALAAQDIKAVNDKMGFRSLEYRIDKFSPSHYVSIGKVDPYIEAALEASYQLVLLEQFDLYQNSDYGKPVFLYQLRPL
ncbi:MAG: glycosyltransferase family 39 protein [Phormidesmis sp.]